MLHKNNYYWSYKPTIKKSRLKLQQNNQQQDHGSHSPGRAPFRVPIVLHPPMPIPRRSTPKEALRAVYAGQKPHEEYQDHRHGKHYPSQVYFSGLYH
ncbi:unnamed protein product [Coffea canephora]|uniref:Uncharacterized protein n=1 Tax=Coffea canephora TaxID=49390 RepID=A0A068TLU5_COFCA|nr:unnamed protein product [Coffea canephora]